MTTPTPPTPHDSAGEQMHDALRAAAPGDTHVEAGLADLQDRLTGAGAAPTPITHRRASRKVLAAAAVVLVLAAFGLAVVTLTRDDDTSKVISTPNVPAATGWYVPLGLDPAWKLQTIRSLAGDSPLAPTCPCLRRTWAAGDGATSLLLWESVATQPNVDDVIDRVSDAEKIDGINLGQGITARGATGPSPSTDTVVAWQHEGRRFMLAGSGVSPRHVIDAAHAIVDDGQPSNLSLPGVELVDEVAVPDTIRSYQAVEVTLKNAATGAQVIYTLTPPGSEALVVLGDVQKVELPGAAAPALRVELGSQEIDNAPPVATYLDRRPGASVVAIAEPDSTPSGSGEDAEADVRTVLASLKPASAEVWAAFVRSAAHPAHDANDLLVGSLMDLTDAPSASEPGPTVTTSSAPVTATSLPAATTSTSTPASSGVVAEDLGFAPVLGVEACPPGGGEPLAEPSDGVSVVPDRSGHVCYRIGPQALDGTSLERAEAAQEGTPWFVSVEARAEAKDDLNGLFNECFDGTPSCPAQGDSGRGSVAIVLDGQVLSAPAVNGRDLADDGFMISGDLTEAEARALAVAINAG